MQDREEAVQQSPLYQPSAHQERMFGAWIRKDLGHDELGQWLGWCPLHTPPEKRTKPHLNATFDFRKSSFQCHGDPSCVATGKRKRVSLQGLSDLLALTILNRADNGDS